MHTGKGRTDLLGEADLVDNNTIAAEIINGTSNVNITWEGPQNPNGLIKSYEVAVINTVTKAVGCHWIEKKRKEV